jgi:hypothetical protein
MSARQQEHALLFESERVTDGMLDVAPDAGIPGQPTVGGQRLGAV